MFGCEQGASVTVEARAKINLTLNIMGVKDKMHIIDTIIVPIDLADTVTVSQACDFKVNYSDGRAYPHDTALVAAKLISAGFGTPAVSVSITKRIPEGKGLGGSSANAAGVARAMQQLFSLPQIPSAALLQIGSDVPAMYLNTPVRARGLGEDITYTDIKALYGVLLIPYYSVSTSEAYAQYDKIGGETADIQGFLAGTSPAKNSLERAALFLEPRLKILKNALTASGFPDVVMTGSGSGFIGFTKSHNQYTKAKNYLESLCLTCQDITIRGFKIHNDTERLCQKTN